MSTGCKAVAQLAPEQQKALREFQNRLPEWETLRDPVPDSIIPSGFFAFAYQPFPKLAHGSSWIWNQTNGKVNVCTEEGQNVLLQKMNARKRKNCPKAPSYKVWLYTMESGDGSPTLFAIWCEKGFEPSSEEGVDTMESGEKAEKKVVSCSLNINTPVRVPTIQQVKEFNHMDSILKKRERPEVFHHSPSPNEERTLPLPARKHPRVRPSEIPSARNFAPGGPPPSAMGSPLNFQPVNSPVPPHHLTRRPSLPSTPPLSLAPGDNSIQRIFSSYNPPQVHAMGSPVQRSFLPSMTSGMPTGGARQGGMRMTHSPTTSKSSSTDDVGDTLHSLSLQPSSHENSSAGGWVPTSHYTDVKTEGSGALPKSLLSRFDDPSRLPLPSHHDVARQSYDYPHYQYRYPPTAMAPPSPSDETVRPE